MDIAIHTEWKEKLTAHHINHQTSVQTVVENYLDYAKSVFEYSEYCDSSKGGSTFSKNMNKWFGTDKNKASELSKIGSEHEYFMDNAEHLPIAHSSIFTLTKMSNSEVRKAIRTGVLTKDTTTAQLKKFKVEIDNEDSRKDQVKVNEEGKIKHIKAVEDQDEIPSEELLDDLELVGLDDNGNERWEPKGVSFDNGEKEERANEITRNEKTLQKLAQEIHDLIIKVADIDLAEDFLGELKGY